MVFSKFACGVESDGCDIIKHMGSWDRIFLMAIQWYISVHTESLLLRVVSFEHIKYEMQEYLDM